MEKREKGVKSFGIGEKRNLEIRMEVMSLNGGSFEKEETGEVINYYNLVEDLGNSELKHKITREIYETLREAGVCYGSKVVGQFSIIGNKKGQVELKLRNVIVE